MSIDVTFPAVLDHLNYEHRVTRRSVTVDAADILHWYCREWATLGMRYERFVHSDENRAHPHSITRANVSNSTNLRSRGWSWAILEPYLDRPQPELARIPVDADLLTTSAYDADVAALVNRFAALRGVKLANATKFLYQKRPALIPVLDELARRAFGVHWLKGGYGDWSHVLALAFTNIREFDRRNAAALDRLEAWLAEQPDLTDGLRFTRLRLIDILAWSTVLRLSPSTSSTPET